LNRRGIVEAFRERVSKTRYGGLAPRQRWVRRFDLDVTDLSTLPIGLFDAKSFILPRQHLPRTKEQLLSLCRRLVDRGQNAGFIEIVLKGWPPGRSLEQHVDLLWALRERHRLFVEDVIRGRHGRALRRLARRELSGDLSNEVALDLIVRQGLLWCANDAQMVSCGARASMIMPFGRLIRTRMKVFKAGTALRLMRCGIVLLDVLCSQYQTLEEEERDGANGAKLKGTVAKSIGYALEKQWRRRGRTVEQDRADLDQAIPYIRGRLPQMKARMAFYEHYNAAATQEDHRESAGGSASNKHRYLHAIWYSGLSPAAGMAVALSRFAMAERHLPALVEAAFRNASKFQERELDPLPAFPAELAGQREFEERVLDLVHAARLVHLRDEDCLSRTRRRASIEAAVTADPALLIRDPLDKAGRTFVRRAFAFLGEMGQRPRDAHIRSLERDPRVWTYWMMDCVPEFRLTP
jgi:hypothetical protein